MSGTLRTIIVLAAFVALPNQAFGFDFEKEIAKQNQVYTDVSPCVGTSKDKCKPAKKDKDLKIMLISKKS